MPKINVITSRSAAAAYIIEKHYANVVLIQCGYELSKLLINKRNSEENNRQEARDHFKKIRDNKGTFIQKMGNKMIV